MFLIACLRNNYTKKCFSQYLSNNCFCLLDKKIFGVSIVLRFSVVLSIKNGNTEKTKHLILMIFLSYSPRVCCTFSLNQITKKLRKHVVLVRTICIYNKAETSLHHKCFSYTNIKNWKSEFL